MKFSKHQSSGELSPICWGSGCTDSAVPAASQARASRGCQKCRNALGMTRMATHPDWTGCAGHTWISCEPTRTHTQSLWAPAQCLDILRKSQEERGSFLPTQHPCSTYPTASFPQAPGVCQASSSLWTHPLGCPCSPWRNSTLCRAPLVRGLSPSQGKESECCGWRGSQHPESSSNCCF